MTNINDLAGSLDEQNKQQQRQQKEVDRAAAAEQNADKVVNAVDKNTQSTTEGLKNVKGEVKVTNPDLSKTSDITKVVDSINKMNITTFMGAGGYQDMASNMKALANEVQSLQQKFQQEGLTSLSGSFTSLVNKLAEISKQLNGTKVAVDDSFSKAMAGLKKSIDGIDFKPSVNVAAPEAKVVTTPVDFKPVLSALTSVEQAIKDSETAETEIDLTPVTTGLSQVQKAITALRFPVPNYVLPFVDNTGKAVQVKLDSAGNLPTAGGGGGGGGASTIADGADVAEGTTTDVAVVGDSSGTVSAKLRGINKALAGTLTVNTLSATGSAVPANGFYQGGQAKTSLPTAGTDGNLVGATYDKFGRQVVLIDGIRDIAGTQTTTISASTSETTIGTAVASTFLDLTSVLISNTSATAARIDFRDTTAGSVIFSIYVPAGDTRGFVVHTPIPQTTVNTNWTAQSSASVTDLRVFIKFIRNK